MEKLYTIFYQKLNDKADFFLDRKVTLEEMKETHAEVASIKAKDLEDVFFKMNDPWNEGHNPLATTRGQFKIKVNGVGHTSMSVNDIAKDVQTQKYFRCGGCGWEEVE